MSREAAVVSTLHRFHRFWPTIHVVSVTDSVKSRAKRLLGIHALRAANALQLGAALTFSEDEPRGHDFVCRDARLCEAAGREGFTVLP